MIAEADVTFDPSATRRDEADQTSTEADQEGTQNA
jgi:hypothetical protein